MMSHNRTVLRLNAALISMPGVSNTEDMDLSRLKQNFEEVWCRKIARIWFEGDGDVYSTDICWEWVP